MKRSTFSGITICEVGFASLLKPVFISNCLPGSWICLNKKCHDGTNRYLAKYFSWYIRTRVHSQYLIIEMKTATQIRIHSRKIFLIKYSFHKCQTELKSQHLHIHIHLQIIRTDLCWFFLIFSTNRMNISVKKSRSVLSVSIISLPSCKKEKPIIRNMMLT